MNAGEIIRSVIPNADEVTIDYIMWGRTTFPFGQVSAKSLYRAAARVQRCAKNGTRLCDFCDNRAEAGRWSCERCDKALNRKEVGRNAAYGGVFPEGAQVK